MPWLYLCDNCHQKLFDIDSPGKSECCLCGDKAKLPKGFKMCNACSYETKMCMACGERADISDNIEKMMEKANINKAPRRKNKRRKK